MPFLPLININQFNINPKKSKQSYEKTLFFCILLLALKVYTQTVSVNEVSLDQMLVNISKTTVTSGIIYERVAPFANLYNFNTNPNRNKADFKFFK